MFRRTRHAVRRHLATVTLLSLLLLFVRSRPSTSFHSTRYGRWNSTRRDGRSYKRVGWRFNAFFRVKTKNPFTLIAFSFDFLASDLFWCSVTRARSRTWVCQGASEGSRGRFDRGFDCGPRNSVYELIKQKTSDIHKTDRIRHSTPNPREYFFSLNSKLFVRTMFEY